MRLKEVDSILEWISDARYGQRHAHLQAIRQPGIGNWLLETPKFVKWKTEAPPSVLLGRGIGLCPMGFSYL